MDDIQLTHAISGGDQVAFKLFFERHYNPLTAYITTFTNDRNLAEDLVQQAFIKIWKHRKKLRLQQSPKNYLYTIAYHGFIDHYRETKRASLVLDALKRKALEGRIQEAEDVAALRIEKLRAIIDGLPPKCQEILKLNKIQRLKYGEIADVLGISVKTVESQMQIAYRKIREEVRKGRFTIDDLRFTIGPGGRSFQQSWCTAGSTYASLVFLSDAVRSTSVD